MATLEQVEKLRQYANVSYEQAKAALEACDGEILDAIVYLEQRGNAKPPTLGGEYTTQRANKLTPPIPNASDKTETFSSLLLRFWRWLWQWFKNLFTNLIVVKRKGEVFFSFPIIFLVIAFCADFWVTCCLLVLGLFFRCTYSFQGKAFKKDSNVNNIMDSVSKTAEDIKQSVKNSTRKQDEDDKE